MPKRSSDHNQSHRTLLRRSPRFLHHAEPQKSEDPTAYKLKLRKCQVRSPYAILALEDRPVENPSIPKTPSPNPDRISKKCSKLRKDLSKHFDEVGGLRRSPRLNNGVDGFTTHAQSSKFGSTRFVEEAIAGKVKNFTESGFSSSAAIPTIPSPDPDKISEKSSKFGNDLVKPAAGVRRSPRLNDGVDELSRRKESSRFCSDGVVYNSIVDKVRKKKSKREDKAVGSNREKVAVAVENEKERVVVVDKVKNKNKSKREDKTAGSTRGTGAVAVENEEERVVVVDKVKNKNKSKREDKTAGSKRGTGAVAVENEGERVVVVDKVKNKNKSNHEDRTAGSNREKGQVEVEKEKEKVVVDKVKNKKKSKRENETACSNGEIGAVTVEKEKEKEKVVVDKVKKKKKSRREKKTAASNREKGTVTVAKEKEQVVEKERKRKRSSSSSLHGHSNGGLITDLDEKKIPFAADRSEKGFLETEVNGGKGEVCEVSSKENANVSERIICIGLKALSSEEDEERRVCSAGNLEIRVKRMRKPCTDSKGAVHGWTKEQEAALQRAYYASKPTPHFWKKVAKLVPGKSAQECFDKINPDHVTPPQVRTRSRAKKISSVSIEQFSLSASKLLEPNEAKSKRSKQRGHGGWKSIRKLLQKNCLVNGDNGADLFSMLEPNVDLSANALPNSSPIISTPVHQIAADGFLMKCQEGYSGQKGHKSKFSSSSMTPIISPPVLKPVKNQVLHEKYVDQLHSRDARRKVESRRGKSCSGKENHRTLPMENVDGVKVAKSYLVAKARDAMNELKHLHEDSVVNSDLEDDEFEVGDADDDVEL